MKERISRFFSENLFFINSFSDKYSIDLRFFYLVCSVGVLSCVAGHLMTFILDLDIWVRYSTGIVGVTCILCFLLARKQQSSKYVSWLLILVTFGALITTWFFNSGLQAPNTLYFVLVTICSTIIVPNSQKKYVLFLSIFSYFICMYFEGIHPEWVKSHYTVEKQRMDFYVIYPVITILCFWIINVAILHHQYEKKKSDAANDSKNKLLGILSHDLRSPFATMTNALRFLTQNEGINLSPEEREILLKKLYNSTAQTSTLIDNLLHWTMTQKDGLKLIPTVISLDIEVKQAISIFTNVAKEKRIKMKATYDVQKTIYVDLESTSVVLRNVINNAIKFTKEGGEVIIKVREEEDYATVSIADNGIGMTKEQISKITTMNIEPTYGTNNEKGSGLGLQVSWEFMQANNGKMEVYSAEGKGSEFVLYFPFSK